MEGAPPLPSGLPAVAVMPFASHGDAGLSDLALQGLHEDICGALSRRGRRVGDMAERARTTVTWRLRYALRKAEASHFALGRHLTASVRTGAFCVYRPETPVAWSFEDPAAPVPA